MKFTTQPLVLVRVEAPVQMKLALISAAGSYPISNTVRGEYDFMLPVQQAENFVAWLKAKGATYDSKNWPGVVA